MDQKVLCFFVCVVTTINGQQFANFAIKQRPNIFTGSSRIFPDGNPSFSGVSTSFNKFYSNHKQSFPEFNADLSSNLKPNVPDIPDIPDIPNGFEQSFSTSDFSFPPLHNFESRIAKTIENDFKPMKIFQAKSSMENGVGGTTIIDASGKKLIKKDGTTLECVGQIIDKKPFCQGSLRKFHIRTRQDFCYSEHYSKLNNILCIGQVDHTGLSFNNVNGRYSCKGSDERPVVNMSIDEYQQLCGKLPWGNTYYYFPDVDDLLHVRLPDPDLKCQENRADVCVFRPGLSN